MSPRPPEDVAEEPLVFLVAGKTEIRREWYYFDRMNEALEGRLSPNSRFAAGVAAVKRGGVASVRTCNDARRFMALQREYDESQPSIEEDADPTRQGIPRIVEDLSKEESGGRVDKVADGFTFFSPQTVRVTFVSGTAASQCTGWLISPQALLTAHHCLIDTHAFQHVEVDYGTAQPFGCVAQNCGSINSRIYGYPNYMGDGDYSRDLVLVWSYAWLWPADSPSSWARIIDEGFPTGTSFWVEGYGADMNSPGHGAGVGRSGNHLEGVAWQSGFWWKMYVTSGYGRPCTGDSGHLANNFSLIGSGTTSLAIGSLAIFWSFNDTCPAPGDQVGYTRLDDKTNWIEGIIPNGCAHASSNGTSYIRCW